MKVDLFDFELPQDRIALRPARPEFKTQSVLAVAGNAACTFQDCVFTLDPGDFETRLAVAELAPPGEAMRMENPPRDLPELTFTNCFVRGTGDFLAQRASRPAKLEVVNSLITLGGSFLTAEPNAKGPVTPEVQLSLTKVSTLLANHLAVFRTRKNAADLAPLKGAVSNCLFASSGGKSLGHVEGELSDEAQMRRLVAWDGSHNAYVNYRDMLDQQPRGMEMPLQPFDKRQWLIAGRDDASEWFGRDKLPSFPEDRSLTRADPGDFKSRWGDDAALKGFGADLGQVARPGGEGTKNEERRTKN